MNTVEGKRPRRNAPSRVSGRRLPVIAIAGAVLIILALSSCAPGGNVLSRNTSITADVERAEDPAGFWRGLWHGIIAPITFIISLFNENVNLYEVYNNGGWYNFGFIIGLSMSLGGSGSGAGHASAHSRKKKEETERFYDDGSETREL